MLRATSERLSESLTVESSWEGIKMETMEQMHDAYEERAKELLRNGGDKDGK